MYTESKLYALKSVFEFNSETRCKAYRLILKAINLVKSGKAFDDQLISSLDLHLSKYRHLGIAEFAERVQKATS
jgi:hypothetical protein